MKTCVLLVTVAIGFGGCAGAVSDRYYYTWQCPDGTCRALREDTQRCVVEANKGYVPWIAGPAPRQTMFKDCLEASGYRKLGQSETRPTVTLAPGTGVNTFVWGAR